MGLFQLNTMRSFLILAVALGLADSRPQYGGENREGGGQQHFGGQGGQGGQGMFREHS